MSDALSNAFLQSREIDDELESDLARLRDAGMQEKHRGFMDNVKLSMASAAGIEAKTVDEIPQPMRWALNLPENITAGVMDAARAGFDLIDDAAEEMDKPLEDAHPAALATKGAAKAVKGVKWTVEKLKLGEAWDNLRGELARGKSGSDELTQSAAQFFIPFTAYSKAIKAGPATKAVVADAATMLTSFEPHEARFADLLRLANSDNSLINAYIDAMTADDAEGEWEGRFKNVLDSQVVGLGISGVILAGVRGFKAARNGLKVKPAEEVASAANP